MTKPLLFRLGSLFSDVAGPGAAHELVRFWMSFQISTPRARPQLIRRLAHVLGRESSEAEIHDHFRRLAENYADMVVTLLQSDRPIIRRVIERVRLQALEPLQDALAAGDGVVIATPHYGNVPLACFALADAGIPVNLLVVNPEGYLWTERKNLKLIGLGGAAAECLAALGRNEAVVIYTDLDFFPGGKTKSFFGAPFPPPHGAARLAIAAGCPVVPIRTASNEGLVTVRAFPTLESGLGEDAIEDGILAAMQTSIAADPAQWFLLRDPWDLAESARVNAAQLRYLDTVRRLGLLR